MYMCVCVCLLITFYNYNNIDILSDVDDRRGLLKTTSLCGHGIGHRGASIGEQSG